MQSTLSRRDQLTQAVRTLKKHCRMNDCHGCIFRLYGETKHCRLQQHPSMWPDGSVQAFFSGADLTERDWWLILDMVEDWQERRKSEHRGEEIAALKHKVVAILNEEGRP